jgi:hypothetical protein
LIPAGQFRRRLWPRCNESNRLTFIDRGKGPHTFPKDQRFQGFRTDATAINLIFRT